MIIIRTAEAFARLLSTHPDFLQAQADRLAEYEDYTFDEQAMFAIVEPGETAADVQQACHARLAPPEPITRRGGNRTSFA